MEPRHAEGLVRTLAWRTLTGVRAVVEFDAAGTVWSTTTFSASGLDLVIPAGASLGSVDGTFVIEATGNPITFGPTGAADAFPVDGPVRIGFTPSPRYGHLTFRAGMSPDSAPSIRYFFGDQRAIYPIFAGDAAMLGSIDPVRGVGSLTTAAPDLPSAFMAPDGTPLSLVLEGGKSQFAIAWDPVSAGYYTECAGTWGLRPGPSAPTGPTATFDLMPGLWGLEFFRLKREGASIEFVPGCSAYARNVAGAFGELSTTGPLGQNYTTTWVAFPAGTTASGYYEQPVSNGYYDNAGATLLPAHPLRAADLPPNAFPMAPYGAVSATAAAVQQVEDFERKVLSRVRSGAIALGATASPAGPTGINGPTGATGPVGPTGGIPFGPTGPTAAAVSVVTSQGEQATFAALDDSWLGLELAQAASGQQLVVSDISGTVRTALLNQQLFLVVTNPLALETFASTRYRIDQPALDRLNWLPPQLTALLRQYLGGTVYWDWENFFEPALREVLGSNFDTYQFAVRSAAQYAQLDIAGWSFDLAPLRWRAATMLVLKFCDGALADLAADTSLWTLPSYFNADVDAAITSLAAGIGDATSLADAPFYEAVNSAAWNGVLYLNCSVPTVEFPAQLRGLAAGIDSPTLDARYFGIAGTPLLNDHGALIVQNAPLFARLDYTNDVDLVYSGSPYDFRVLELHVRFANSHVVAFASRVELLIGQFFGERSTIENGANGDNIIFIGTWQQHDGNDTYSFAYNGQNTFAMATSAVLQTVELRSAAFVTLPPPDSDPIVSTFTIAGTLSFQVLQYTDASTGELVDYDVFSYDRLDFGNVVVTMSYEPSANPPARTFTFDPTGTTFRGASLARSGSLCDRLPSQPAAIVQAGMSGAASGAATPAALGYMTLITPLSASGLDTAWYGLELSVQLGSAGGLGSTLMMTGSLILAWSPVTDKTLKLQLALRLPGAGSGRQYVTILGPLRLNVATVALKHTAAGSWLLRAIDVTLQFFSVKFPPNGQIKLEIITDPNPSGHALGWYGAYQKNAASGGADTNGGAAQNRIGNGNAGGAPALTRTARLRLAAHREREQ